MRILYKLCVIALALMLELVVLDFGSEVLFGRSHGPIADTRFRRQERLAAFFEYQKNPSPATKAVFNDEMRLMHKHEDWKTWLTLSLFVVVNGAGIYYYWNYGNRKART